MSNNEKDTDVVVSTTSFDDDGGGAFISGLGSRTPVYGCPGGYKIGRGGDGPGD